MTLDFFDSHPLIVRAIASVSIATLGWLAARILSRVVRSAMLSQEDADPTLAPFMGQVVRVLVIILAFSVALSTAGVEMTSVIAFLGAAGVAIGLAIQGLLTNLIAGLALLAYRPFRVGDAIEVSAIAGEVLAIGILMTDILTADHTIVTIPNAKIWGAEIRNHSRRSARRVEISFVVPLGVDVAALVPGALEAALTVEGVLPQPAPELVLVEVSKDGPLIRLRAWAPSTLVGSVRDRLGVAMQHHFASAGLWDRR